MSIEKKILARLKGYTEAFYKQDYDALADFFYEDEVKIFRSNLEWIAKAMLPFGESDGFMQLFEGVSPEELGNLSDKDFMKMFFSGTMANISFEQVKQVVNSIEIEEVDHAEYIANVKYSFKTFFFEEVTRMNSEVNLILSDDEWYILFRTHMTENFARMRKKIEDFNDAKAKDNLSLAQTPDDEIERFSLYGFRSYDEDTIIHPRFRDAGEFQNGLAPVKIFSKWGYINKRGELAIKPQFDKAETFSEGIALVSQRDEEFQHHFGYINTRGRSITGFAFEAARSFEEGLAAVQKDDKWGYINRTGDVVLPFQYDEANSFEEGKAQVEMDNEILTIDHEGNIINRWDSEDLWDDDEDDFRFDDDDDDDY